MKSNKIIFKFHAMVLLTFLMIFSCSVLHALIINYPGRYELGGDVYEGTADDAITIISNNVTLEFNGHGLFGGKNGVVVESGVTGVVIQNGFIANTAESGILVKDNTSIVQVRHMSIAGCQLSAIEIAGTSAAAMAKNIFIEETVMYGCASGASGSSVVSINYGDNIIMRDTPISYCGNLSNTVNIIEINNSCSAFLHNVLFTECFAGNSLRGILLNNSIKCLFEQVYIMENSAGFGNFIGISLQNAADANGFNMCKVITGSSTSSDAIGYDIDTGASENKFFQCEVSSLEGESAYGFYLHGTGSPSDTINNTIGECIVLNNKARSGNAFGALISRADQSILCKTCFSNQSAPGGIAAAIEFESGTGGDGWSICENKILKNIGIDAAHSFGINLATGSGNMFVQNIASDNGTTSGNQFFGLPANSVTLASYDLINTITLPWTNIGITS